MKNILVILPLFLALYMVSCKNGQKEDSAGLEKKVNTDTNLATSTVLLPSFSVKDANGNALDLQTLKGKKLFVNLWASWCPPCKRELPSIERLFHSVDTNKVKFVLISFDDQFEKAKKYILSRSLKLPIYYPLENPPSLFNVEGIPATFIFNEQGELIRQVVGSEDYDTREYRGLLQ